MKRKLIYTAIGLTMITSLTACGAKTTDNTTSDTNKTELTETKTEIKNNEIVDAISRSLLFTEFTEKSDDSNNSETETTKIDTDTNNNQLSNSNSSNNSAANNNSKTNSTQKSTAPATETTTETPVSSAPVVSQVNPDPVVASVSPAPVETKECPSSSTGNHQWTDHYRTVTVTDKEPWDEQVPTGEYYTKLEEHKYSGMYTNEGWNSKFLGTVDITGWTEEQKRQYEKSNNLLPDCLDGFQTDWIEVPDYNNPIYKTVHHDAVTHTEQIYDFTDCSVCRKKK